MKKTLTMPGLTRKQRLIVLYFALSFCSLCITDKTPLWIVILIVLNFANAARLIKNVPLQKNE